MQKSKSGFTIVELVVVIVVIAILASITIVAYSGAQGRSRDARRKTDVANIAKALEVYYSDNGRYPVTSGSTSINAGWASSVDASWATLENTLVTANDIDSLPTDPRNIPNTGAASTGVIYGTGNFSYAIYVNGGSYCNVPPGQMYLIVYRLESMPKERGGEGDCSVNPLGDSYYSGGASYLRVAR
jgi:general secretion pathway protein G